MLQHDLKDLVLLDDVPKSFRNEMTIEQALTTLNKQMKVSGLRERTIKDYNLYFNHFCKVTGTMYLTDISLANSPNIKPYEFVKQIEDEYKGYTIKRDTV